MIKLTLEQWEAQFKPIKNQFVTDAPFEGTMFETYEGPEKEFVRVQDPNTIWTLHSEGDSQWIQSGWHIVNRDGYFVTEVPFTEETQVMLWDADDADSYQATIEVKIIVKERGPNTAEELAEELRAHFEGMIDNDMDIYGAEVTIRPVTQDDVDGFGGQSIGPDEDGSLRDEEQD